MKTQQLTSKRGTLIKRDWLQGLIMAFIGGVLSSLIMVLQSFTMELDWKVVLFTALASGLAHVFRKLLQDESGTVKIIKD